MAARPRAPVWLIAYGLPMLATVVLLVIGTRYRMPLVPVVLALAGGGVVATIDAVRSRRWQKAAPLLAVMAVVWAGTEMRHDAASRNLSEEQALTGLSLLQEGAFAEAESAYRLAIDTDPRSSFAWDGLGLALQRLLLRNEARQAFARAVELNPSNATAWLHLAVAYELLNNPSGAMNAYRQALAITPHRAETMELYERARRRYAR